MREQIRDTWTGRLTVALMAASVLAGCGGSSTPSSPASRGEDTAASESAPALGTPEVGQCWANVTEALVDGLTWKGTAAVDCAKPHNALTYAVLALRPSFDYSSYERDFGPEVNLPREETVGGETCTYRSALQSVEHDYERPLNLSTASYLPTAAQFKAGARWIRCDLAVSFGDRRRDLPADLVEAVAQNADPYSWCARGSHRSGPKRIGPCTETSTWRVARLVDQAKSATEPYPGAKVARKRATRDCSQQKIWWTKASPSAKAWASGNALSVCWASLVP